MNLIGLLHHGLQAHAVVQRYVDASPVPWRRIDWSAASNSISNAMANSSLQCSGVALR